MLAEGKPHVLLDVREPVQFKICHLKHAVSIHTIAVSEPDPVSPYNSKMPPLGVVYVHIPPVVQCVCVCVCV